MSTYKAKKLPTPITAKPATPVIDLTEDTVDLTADIHLSDSDIRTQLADIQKQLTQHYQMIHTAMAEIEECQVKIDTVEAVVIGDDFDDDEEHGIDLDTEI